MPHIILEYSSDIAAVVDCNGLLRDLHCLLGEEESFETDRIKSRSYPAAGVRVGNEGDRPFVHVSIVFSHGRGEDLRKALGRKVLDRLRSDVRPRGVKVSRSVEIRQFEPGMYFNDYELAEP